MSRSTFNDLQQPYLSIPDPVRDKSWLESVKLFRGEHRWNHYLNQLTLATVLPWLDDQSSELGVESAEAYARILPSPEIARQRWQWVTGTAVALGDRRLIVIPTDSLDASEFTVPQEWVDIPAWCGDYYLMVQLNPEAGRLQLRGYINHRQLKQGRYDEGDRTYRVKAEALVQDIDFLWVMAGLETLAERQAKLLPLPEFSPHQTNRFIQQLAQQLQGQVAPQHQPSPRLALPFQSWASVLSDSQRFNLLCHVIPGMPGTADSSQNSPPSTQLSQWFKGNIEAAWQSWEQFSSPNPVWGVRTVPSQSISRGKRVEFSGIHPALYLWTTVAAEMDGRMKVLVQLRPPAESSDGWGVQPLPRGVALSLITPEEESVQAVMAKERDDYIQLKRFKVLSGQAFTIEVRLGNQTVREQFRA